MVNPKPDKKATNNNLLDESLLASESDYSTGFSSAPDNDTSNKESGDSDCRRRRGDPNEKVRNCSERSDELRRRAFWMLTTRYTFLTRRRR